MSAPFDQSFATLPMSDRYKLLCGLVIPRPIALVTTLGPAGLVNAAPFSFFNVFSEDPPLVVLGLQSKPDGSLKDTATNIRETGCFVVNLVDASLAERMNICSIDFPSDVSEIDMAGLSTVPSSAIAAPRIAEAPVSLECRHYLTLEISRERRLCMGEVLHVHARPGIVDPARLYVDVDKYQPVARLFGNYYATLGEKFKLQRRTYAEWNESGATTPGSAGRSRAPS